MSKISRDAMRAGHAGNLLPLLSTISVPTLLIRADATLGTTLDETAWQQAQQALPAHSRAIEIQGASHNVHRSQFEAFMQVINDFLKQPNEKRE